MLVLLFYSFFYTSMNSQTLQTITLVLVAVMLVLWLTWKFAWSSQELITKQDVQQIVKQAIGEVQNKNQPVAQAPQPTQPTPPPAPTNTKLVVSDFDTFYKTSYVKGSEDAKITVIEFSDFECPYCKRHDNSGTLEQVIEKYGDDVNVIFSHFPLNFHPLAQKAQEASECVGEQGGSDAFYAFKKWLFAEAKPTREAITKVAGTISGVDVTALETCIDAGTYAQKVTDAMNFGKKLGVTGTPGNVVVNNESWEYQKISWAVPASAFDWPISQYMN